MTIDKSFAIALIHVELCNRNGFRVNDHIYNVDILNQMLERICEEIYDAEELEIELYDDLNENEQFNRCFDVSDKVIVPIDNKKISGFLESYLKKSEGELIADDNLIFAGLLLSTLEKNRVLLDDLLIKNNKINSGRISEILKLYKTEQVVLALSSQLQDNIHFESNLLKLIAERKRLRPVYLCFDEELKTIKREITESPEYISLSIFDRNSSKCRFWEDLAYYRDRKSAEEVSQMDKNILSEEEVQLACYEELYISYYKNIMKTIKSGMLELSDSCTLLLNSMFRNEIIESLIVKDKSFIPYLDFSGKRKRFENISPERKKEVLREYIKTSSQNLFAITDEEYKNDSIKLSTGIMHSLIIKSAIDLEPKLIDELNTIKKQHDTPSISKTLLETFCSESETTNRMPQIDIKRYEKRS